MTLVKLNFGKEDSRFIKDYIKAGFAETNNEVVRHALVWFCWNPPPIPAGYKPKKMSEAQLEGKMARQCAAIFTAYRVCCYAKGMVKGRKA